MNKTELEKEIKAIQAFGKKIASSKKKAKESLYKAGITDKNGNLMPQYK